MFAIHPIKTLNYCLHNYPKIILIKKKMIEILIKYLQLIIMSWNFCDFNKLQHHVMEALKLFNSIS